MTAACPATEKSRLEALLETISASRLNCFHSCRLKFYFRYVLELANAQISGHNQGTRRDSGQRELQIHKEAFLKCHSLEVPRFS